MRISFSRLIIVDRAAMTIPSVRRCCRDRRARANKGLQSLAISTPVSIGIGDEYRAHSRTLEDPGIPAETLARPCKIKLVAAKTTCLELTRDAAYTF